MDVRHVGRLVEARITALGLTATDVATRAELNPKTVRGLIAGDRWPRTSSRGRIEQVLGWPAGTIAAVGDGEAPPRNDLQHGPCAAMFAAHNAVTPMQKLLVLHDLVTQIMAEAAEAGGDGTP